MSNTDPEVLYLILTKVAGKETVYGHNAASGRVTHRELCDIYEKITGNRPGARLNWSVPLKQLNALLTKCGLPPLAEVVVEEKNGAPSERIYATKWPAFSQLKRLYRK